MFIHYFVKAKIMDEFNEVGSDTEYGKAIDAVSDTFVVLKNGKILTANID